MSEIAKDKLILKVLIASMGGGLLLIAGLLYYLSRGSTPNSDSGTMILPLILSFAALMGLCFMPLLARLVVFPAIERDEKTTAIEKLFAKTIVILAIAEGSAAIGQVAIFVARIHLAVLPAWVYINYLYIPIFFFVAYKIWPRSQAAESDTFGGDLLEDERQKQN
jgi:Zn-dependent protease with chaperone function